MCTGTKGAYNELIAATDLMKCGYHVFRSLSPSCPFDLVVFSGRKSLHVEVRTAQRYTCLNGKRRINFSRNGEHDGLAHIYAVVHDGTVYYMRAEIDSIRGITDDDPRLIKPENLFVALQ